MTTFSQLVDEVIQETRRPDMVRDIAAYLNQTIREVHFTPDRNNVVFYRDNLREQLLTATSPAGFGFEIPNPATFQAMQAVRYDSQGGIYPPEMTPGRGLQDKERFYYRAGTRYYFAGYGGTNALISIAYYEYPRRLLYYPKNQRPAEYTADAGWTFASEFNQTEELRIYAQIISTNWLLQRWTDTILEGVRAKVYKRVSDQERARLCYSLYLSSRQGLYSSESADQGGYA